MKEQELRIANNFISICKQHEKFCSERAEKYERRDLFCTASIGVFSFVGVVTTAVIGPLGIFVFFPVIFPLLAKRNWKMEEKAIKQRHFANFFGGLRKEIEKTKERNLSFDHRKFSIVLKELEKGVMKV